MTNKRAGIDREANACFDTMTHRLTNTSNDSTETGDTLDKLRALDGVRKYPSRVKCATLAWHAMTEALRDTGKTATTE